MEEDFAESQDSAMNDVACDRSLEDGDIGEPKDFGDAGGFDESYEDEEGGNFRGMRGRGNFRARGGRGPPPGWMNGPPPMRFRGRGYGPGGPPMRGGRGFFRGRGRGGFGNNNGPNFENWGPMGPPPPGMMGGPPPFGPPPGMMGPGGPMGPPPNMMGQPPPFGAPPGMPPPNMPAPEMWVEAKSEDGKSYYYHSRTRETTWTRPAEGPTCKVITQSEMEAMAAAGTLPGIGPQMQMGGPMPGMMMSNGMMPPGGMPPGGMPPGGMPPGGMPPGGMPPGGMPPGGMPPGGMPPQGMMNMPPPGSGPPSMPSFMNQPPPWANNEEKDDSASDNEDSQSRDSVPSITNGNMLFPPPVSANIIMPRLTSVASSPPIVSLTNKMNTPSSMSFRLQGALNGHQNMSGPPGMNGPPGMANAPPNMSGGPPQNMGGLPPNMSGGPNMGGPPPNMSGPPPSIGGGNGGPGVPPLGFPAGWGAWGGWPPPLVAQPPPNMAQSMPNSAGGAAANSHMQSTPMGVGQTAPEMKELPSQPTSAKEELIITADLMAAASEWTTHRSPEGRPYYYNAGKQESVWEKPKPLKELEDLQAKIAAENDKIERKVDKIDFDDGGKHMEDAHPEAQAATAEADRLEAQRQESDRLERERAEKERQEKERVEKEKAEKEKAKADKTRPVTSTPISGTPWCVVWTGDGRVFFYNPTARSSVWERPPQLIGRADVDKYVSNPPAVALHNQRMESADSTTSTNVELKRTADSDSEQSDTEPPKKAKQDEIITKKQQLPSTGEVIDMGKEAAAEAEVRAAQQRAVVPLDQRMTLFLALLHEKQVSAFSTWEKELHKIVFDSRYLLLLSKERKQVYDKYVRERAEEERKEKKNRLQQKKNAFKDLMEEAKLHSKSSYTEFSSKHGRDERFKAIEKARDRETYFNDYLSEVKKKEKEEKEKKKEQAKVEFITMLKEKSVDRRARWLDAKKKVDTDPRYKAVDSSSLKEDYFREYCRLVKEERKKEKDGKEKDRERSSKKEKKDKERDKDKEKEKDRDKDSKKQKKKEKEKSEATESDSKQPTPPPDQWADILGIPGEEKDKDTKTSKEKPVKETKQKQTKKEKPVSPSPSPEKEMHSPKQLRSSKKELPTPDKKSPLKSPIKTPPKKRKTEEPVSSEQTEVAPKNEKKKADKSDKKKKKKTEKD